MKVPTIASQSAKLFIALTAMMTFNSCGEESNKAEETDNAVTIDKNLTEAPEEVAMVGNEAFQTAILDGRIIAEPQDNISIVYNDGKVFYVNTDGDDSWASKRFFCHVNKRGEDIINKDFAAKDKLIYDGMQNGNRVQILQQDIPEYKEGMRLMTGSFTGSARDYTAYIEFDKMGARAYNNDMRFAGWLKDNKVAQEFKNALLEGSFYDNPIGHDFIFYDDVVYYAIANATQEQKDDYIFLHVTDMDGTFHNMDFKPASHNVSAMLQDERFKDLHVLRRDLREIGPASIGTGQLKDGARTWSVNFKVQDLMSRNDMVYNGQYDN